MFCKFAVNDTKIDSYCDFTESGLHGLDAL